MSATKILWGQITTVFLIVLLTTWGATQWTAWRLGFQAQVGTPWFELAGWPVYYPPAFFWWWYFYDAYAPPIFVEGAMIAASGGFISIAVAIAMSVWRAREAKNVETYGSARWAELREVKAAGLLGPDGVVLGKLGDAYLRHDGPEHVLCFAPTRSGKGVGLVVPTLLTWPGSAIVHDIKGENWQLTAGFRARHGRVLLFDPTNAKSAAYNPLLEVRRGEWEVRDVQNVADVLVDPEGSLADLIADEKPATLYLVVPPSDISRTKPLIRLVLNQIGRRLTEDLHARDRRHRVLMMLDEFPALGRLDFFESALAFMAGYGLKSFLIAQSLNQIEKAYGPNNAILDNCHVRVSFASNDERTAKRVSDALGTATEMKAMRNYAGHRLSPWLGHLMVSRSETARPLLTPGEVMQLPATDEIVMAAGVHPIRAKKARYFEDRRFKERIVPSPDPAKCGRSARKDAWSELKPQRPDAVLAAELDKAEDAANGGLRREPELPDHVAIAKETTGPAAADEFAIMLEDEPEDAARQRQALRQQMRGVARQVALDPNDGIDL
jgi:type IV secretory pathway TraG/TraD family ATPase VirD4